MKKLIVFTLLLISSAKAVACVESAFGGEDFRYCIFDPQYFSFDGYASFCYNADKWGYSGEFGSLPPAEIYPSNVWDWYRFTNKKVSLESISNFNDWTYGLTDIHPNSGNAFLDFLYKNKKWSVIKYFSLAKQGEEFNTTYEGENENSW